MAYADEYTGPLKAKLRNAVLDGSGRFASILDLPARRCLSLHRLLDTGSIDPSCKVTVVERSGPDMRRIKAHCRRSLPFAADQMQFYRGEVHDCPHRGPYDLVNLDTCSSLSEGMLRWISRLEFVPGATLNVWVTVFRNNGRFLHNLKQTFCTANLGVKQQIERENENVFTLDRKIGPLVMASVAAIRCALNRYSMRVETALYYTEHVNDMYVYRFSDITPCEKPTYPFVFDLLTDEDSPLSERFPNDPGTFRGNIPELCVQAVALNSTGLKSCATKRMQTKLDRHPDATDAMWVKAGWKSAASRIINSNPLYLDRVDKKEVHEFIQKCRLSKGPRLGAGETNLGSAIA